MFLSYKYDNAAFANNAALTSITYKNFGVEEAAGGRAQGDLNNTEISGVTSAQWTTLIENNTHLWTSITTIMNSLGYDADINSKVNDSGQVVNSGHWPKPSGTSNPSWWQADINKTDLINGTDTTTNKWWDNHANAGSTSEQANTKLEFNLTQNTDDGKVKSVYFKHNGIIWEWTQTLTPNAEDINNSTVSITLSSHSSTVPNVYKGTYKVEGTAPTGTQPDDTAYTFKMWSAPASDSTPHKAEDCGVSFTFKVTA